MTNNTKISITNERGYKHNKHRIAVVMLNYNDKSNIENAVDSLLIQDYQNFKIIVIDNGSIDGSIELIKIQYPNLTLVENSNIGYAGAYAKFLAHIFRENDYAAAVLLNTDVVVERNWLSELVKSAFSDDSIAFSQPKIFIWQKGKTDLFNTCGNKINFLGFGYCGEYKKKESDINTSKDFETAYASGCSLLVKREAYLKLSGLDPDFFAYLEDQDLGWRGWMYGYKSIVSVNSIMWHKYVFQKNPANKKKFFLLERNRLLFVIKNYSSKTIILLTPALFVMEIGILYHAFSNGYIKEKITSYISFIKSISKTLKKRKVIQKKRILSDSELFHRLSPTIEFDEVKSKPLKWANKIFSKYYYFIIKFI